MSKSVYCMEIWSKGSTWKGGIVLERTGDRSYLIQGENGRQYVRNRVDLRSSEIPYDYTPEFELSQPINKNNSGADPPVPSVPIAENCNPPSSPVQDSTPPLSMARNCIAPNTNKCTNDRMPGRPQRAKKRPDHLNDFVGLPWSE